MSSELTLFEEPKKDNSMEARRTRFYNQLWAAAGMNYLTYSREMLREFFDYWTESNPNGRKMRFEAEKFFNFKRRLGTWKKNNAKFERSSGNKEKGKSSNEDDPGGFVNGLSW